MNSHNVFTGRSKYGNRKVTTPEGTFDSQKEYKRWQELQLLQKAGKISNLERQKKFVLIPKIGKHRETAYIADFCYNEDGKPVIVDVKGYKTEIYRLKQKLLRFIWGIEIVEV